jgi:hypothetical protein
VGAAEALGGSIHDGLKDTLRIVIELIVPEPQDVPAMLPQENVAPLIALRVGVLTAVQFDDQLCLSASEIGIIRADRQLARELRAQAGQKAPKLPLVPRGIVAQ